MFNKTIHFDLTEAMLWMYVACFGLLLLSIVLKA